MNKKFFSLILMTALFVVVLSSCKKDDIPTVQLETISLNERVLYDEHEYEYEHNYEYEYGSKNHITKLTRNSSLYVSSYFTLEYDANGDLAEYYSPGSPSARSTRATFSKNGNKITFIMNYHPTVPLFGSINGELELNSQGLPVKLTSEDAGEYITTGSNYWSYTIVTLTWQNGNLTKTEWEEDWKRENVILDWEKGEIDHVEREEGSSTGIATYTHDSMKTPFYHCNTPKWALWWLNYYGIIGHYGYNRNNVKTVTLEDGSTITYDYTYNGNGFPATQTWITETTYSEPQKLYYGWEGDFFFYVKMTTNNTETYIYK